MVAALVGEAFLSAIVQLLVEQLVSTEFHDYFRNRKLSISLLEELETTMLTLQAVLDDAEQKQIVNLAVKQWLGKLKDTILDAKVLLIQIRFDSLQRKVKSTEAKSITNQAWNFFSSPFDNTYGEINSQMKNICQRLQLFAQQKDILGLQTVSLSGRVSSRTSSSSMINKSLMVGRKIAKKSDGMRLAAKTLGGSLRLKMASAKILKARKQQKRDVNDKASIVHTQI